MNIYHSFMKAKPHDKEIVFGVNAIIKTILHRKCFVWYTVLDNPCRMAFRVELYSLLGKCASLSPFPPYDTFVAFPHSVVKKSIPRSVCSHKKIIFLQTNPKIQSSGSTRKSDGIVSDNCLMSDRVLVIDKVFLSSEGGWGYGLCMGWVIHCLKSLRVLLCLLLPMHASRRCLHAFPKKRWGERIKVW
ncbi:unnamed protein product [Trypanosoma congolense IL3000]|uniref:WGS project CAEQ00000000 data, annotated contig 380 n=1 Tax=Trypanosoma congolense (strain IL3000) TaxID=1068625 RepID=F9WFF0_TRYCI|nr:unnamed protein product [Trypanosoma congolense IL3000]